MSYTVNKLAPCRNCDEPTNRRERGTRDPLCLDCAMKKMTDNLHSLNDHSGEGYERWLAGYARFIHIQSTARGTPYNLQ